MSTENTIDVNEPKADSKSASVKTLFRIKLITNDKVNEMFTCVQPPKLIANRLISFLMVEREVCYNLDSIRRLETEELRTLIIEDPAGATSV